MIYINLALPSGKRKCLALEESSKVGDLKKLAQKAFGQSLVRLVSGGGHVLNDPEKSLEDAGIHDGDHVTAVAQQAKLAATAGAFALWFDGEHKIVTWGHRGVTSNCYAVRNNVESVHLVQGTRISLQEEAPEQFQYKAGAFAAILEDGSVVTWGQPQCGGDSSEVRHQLRNVQQIQATSAAFAAILADGSVVTWGDPDYGSDSSAVEDQLRNVKQIEANDGAFAAILADGSVVTWGLVGPEDCGANSSAIQHQLRSVQQIRATSFAFAAILAD